MLLLNNFVQNPNLHPAAAAMIRFKRKEIPPAFFRIFSVGAILLTRDFSYKLTIEVVQFLPVDVNSFLLQPSESEGKKKPAQSSFRSYMWIKANENIGEHIHSSFLLFVDVHSNGRSRVSM